MVSVESCFSDLCDPRVEGRSVYTLLELIIISIVSLLCGCNSFEEIAEFAEARYEWFLSYLPELPSTPSGITLSRVFNLIPSEEMERCFCDWITKNNFSLEGDIVAIDGKSLCGSGNTLKGDKLIHMVSAYASRLGLVLGQERVMEKSNEITAIPALIERLALKGAIVTCDAMGCQEKIVEKIIEKKADYLLAVKQNQSLTYQTIQAAFSHADNESNTIVFTRTASIDNDHGRLETRKYMALPVNLYASELKDKWRGINSIVRVEGLFEKTLPASSYCRYYISSLSIEKMDRISEAVRAHWGIENKVHWVLDVTFSEDHSQIRKKYTAENFSRLRRMTLNLIKQDTTHKKKSLNLRRKRAGWDNHYLHHLMRMIIN